MAMALIGGGAGKDAGHSPPHFGNGWQKPHVSRQVQNPEEVCPRHRKEKIQHICMEAIGRAFAYKLLPNPPSFWMIRRPALFSKDMRSVERCKPCLLEILKEIKRCLVCAELKKHPMKAEVVRSNTLSNRPEAARKL